MRYVLAFDTALEGCSAAVLDLKTDKAFAESETMNRGQAEHLVPMINRAVAGAGIAIKDIDLIAVTTGPGAFTGLRIGLATARALGLALDKPVAGVTTLEVLAHQYSGADPFAVILETKRADFYYQFFHPTGAPAAGPAADIIARAGKNMTAIGDGLARFRASAPEWAYIEGYEHPDPAVLARLAAARHKAGELAPAEPVYLRPPDVSTPKKQARILRQ